jgi:hypothetical protein
LLKLRIRHRSAPGAFLSGIIGVASLGAFSAVGLATTNSYPMTADVWKIAPAIAWAGAPIPTALRPTIASSTLQLLMD